MVLAVVEMSRSHKIQKHQRCLAHPKVPFSIAVLMEPLRSAAPTIVQIVDAALRATSTRSSKPGILLTLSTTAECWQKAHTLSL